MPDFNDILQSTLPGAINGGLGAIMGLFTAKANDKRQINQAQKLQDMQIAGSKEMTDYQWNKQLEMWKATNYPEQMKQLSAAGLNPGLLYGMKGGGGITTGAGATEVSGQQAHQNPGEIQAMTGMGLQMGMQAAQIELMKAEARKANTEADVTGGAGKENIEAQTQSIIQGIKNQQAQQQLTEVNTRIATLDATLKTQTLDDNIKLATALMDQAEEIAHNMKTKNFIDDATQFNVIDSMKADLATKLLQQEAIKQGISLSQAQITKIHSDITQAAQQLTINQGHLQAHQLEATTSMGKLQHEAIIQNVSEGTKLTMNTVGQILGIIGLGKFKGKHE